MELVEKCPYALGLGIADAVMSNFDHTVDAEVAARLKVEETWAPYPGRDFWGEVWWDRGANKWACLVRVHHVAREVVRDDSLEGLMKTICAKYGDA